MERVKGCVAGLGMPDLSRTGGLVCMDALIIYLRLRVIRIGFFVDQVNGFAVCWCIMWADCTVQWLKWIVSVLGKVLVCLFFSFLAGFLFWVD